MKGSCSVTEWLPFRFSSLPLHSQADSSRKAPVPEASRYKGPVVSVQGYSSLRTRLPYEDYRAPVLSVLGSGSKTTRPQYGRVHTNIRPDTKKNAAR